MEKLIITAAICGAEVTKDQNPIVPYTVKEIGREAESAFKAGASIIHLHVREDDGTPTQSKEKFKDSIDEIKKRCSDVIIMPSTGGAVGMTNEERLQPIYLQPVPLMASLDCGTMNFGGDEIFVNTETSIKYFAEEMNRLGIKPELECFDKSHIDMALRQRAKGFIKDPMHFNLVFGVNGGISATPRDMVFLVESLPKDSTYTVTGIGRHEFPVATMGIIYGGHVRVGLEDNLFLSKGKLAESNGQLVEKVVRISKELGREIASPKEAKQILNLKNE
ncbi:MAG: 3-keto-5-aminohexanoate cleavage protein [Candidatus Lokiarchaeota archaeon]|nr:3-keto-5-aminohexanoate cleavage protein [Candidatus Lokiarchaeota archaeon]